MLFQALEDLVQRIYEAQGYTLAGKPGLGRDLGYDFALKSPEGENIIVQIKVFRTRNLARADILNMVAQLNSVRQEAKAEKALLIIGGSIGIPIHDTGNIEIVDFRKLGELASSSPRLLDELSSIAREASPISPGDIDIPAYVIFGDAHQGIPNITYGSGAEQPKGKSLGAALRAVPAGKKGARAFEEKCYEALSYIFEKDFSNWSKQKVTDGGASRYDVIARISSDHDFWKSIIVYFRSWYVVFEFKNFSQKIAQGQIYTTEKYLFLGAMRTVAVIISRKGADKNALAATRGAVRESGKLIVHLSIDDVCKMLDMKDNLDDPNAFLFDLLDEMLMKLER
jgi:hypothetical protein